MPTLGIVNPNHSHAWGSEWRRLAYIYPAEHPIRHPSIPLCQLDINWIVCCFMRQSIVIYIIGIHLTDTVVISSSSAKKHFRRMATNERTNHNWNEWILIAIDHTQDRIWCGRDGLVLPMLTGALMVQKSAQWFIATLNATSNTPPTLAEEHLSEYLSFRYNHAPRTLYKNRYALIAGHFTILKSGRTREEQWYKPNWYTLEQKIPSEREAKLEVDYLLRRSLEPHLFSQQKFGVAQGGLDSRHFISCQSMGFQLTHRHSWRPRCWWTPFAGRIAHLYNSPNHLLRLKSQILSMPCFKCRTTCSTLPNSATAIQDRSVILLDNGWTYYFQVMVVMKHLVVTMATIARNIRRLKPSTDSLASRNLVYVNSANAFLGLLYQQHIHNLVLLRASVGHKSLIQIHEPVSYKIRHSFAPTSVPES